MKIKVAITEQWDVRIEGDAVWVTDPLASCRVGMNAIVSEAWPEVVRAEVHKLQLELRQRKWDVKIELDVVLVAGPEVACCVGMNAIVSGAWPTEVRAEVHKLQLELRQRKWDVKIVDAAVRVSYRHHTWTVSVDDFGPPAREWPEEVRNKVAKLQSVLIRRAARTAQVRHVVGHGPRKVKASGYVVTTEPDLPKAGGRAVLHVDMLTLGETDRLQRCMLMGKRVRVTIEPLE